MTFYPQGFAKKCGPAQAQRLHQARPDGQDPRLHHQRVEVRHAQVLRQGPQAEGAHQEFADSLQKDPGMNVTKLCWYLHTFRS